MSPMRVAGAILAVALAALTPAVAASARSGGVAASSGACSAFGATWAHRYNARGGPVKIVAICCGAPQASSGNSACRVMVTGRPGFMGAGMLGCSLLTLARNGEMLANRHQTCARVGRKVSLPS
jgi:hypothetical protein